MRNRCRMYLLLLLIVLLIPQMALGQAATLRSYVVGAGGVESAGTTYTNSSTVGQTAAGMIGGEAHTVGSGFWPASRQIAIPGTGGGGDGGTLSGGLALQVGGYASLEEDSSLDVSGQAITVEAWIKHDGGSTEDAVIAGKTRGAGGYQLRLDGPGEEVRAHFGVRFPDRPAYFVSSSDGIRAGRWTHLAGTYDGEVLRIYLDGVPAGEQALQGFTVGESDVPLRLGTNHDASGQFFSGRLDEVRVWSEVRSHADIQDALYHPPEGDKTRLEAYYTFEAFLPGGGVADESEHLNDLSLTEHAAEGAEGAMPLPPDLYALPEAGGVRLVWTARGVGTASGFNLYRAGETDGSDLERIGTVAESCYPDACSFEHAGAEPGVPGFYTARAVSAAGIEGDLAVPVPAAAYLSANGSALTLGGAGSASVTDRPSLDISGHTVTLEAWINHDGGSAEDAVIVGKTRDDGGYQLRLDGPGEEVQAHFGVRFPERPAYYVSSENEIPSRRWTHLAGTYDGDMLRIYVDGVLAGEQALQGLTVGESDVPLRLGTNNHASGQFFSGQIDEVRLWNEVRSPAEISRARDHPLVGDEEGLLAYFRFDQDTGSSAAYGSTRAPMTVSLEGDATFGVSTATPNEVPDGHRTSFALKQNFPNPFTFSTTIRFDLPWSARVALTIYDIVGREVMRVEGGKFAPGAERKITLDLSDLSAGMYVYRIRATMHSGIDEASGRMVLVR